MNNLVGIFLLLCIGGSGFSQISFNSSDAGIFQKFGTPQAAIGKNSSDLSIKNLGKLSLLGPLNRKDLKALTKQTQLEILLLNSNGIDQLPEAPFTSPHLLVFSTKNNSLRSLPLPLIQSSSLEILELDNVALDSIPSSTLLPNLELLRIVKNAADSLVFPDSLPEMPSLRFIEFFQVPLTRFPEFIVRCPNLERIVLNGCRLDSIPEQISSLAKLHTLDVENNALKKLPHALGFMPNLRSLNVSANQLTSFPERLMYAPNLEELKVKNNPLPSEDFEILRIIGRATKTFVD
jgi:Leucine-rich repeat (LRR) protein